MGWGRLVVRKLEVANIRGGVGGAQWPQSEPEAVPDAGQALAADAEDALGVAFSLGGAVVARSGGRGWGWDVAGQVEGIGSQVGGL